MRRFSVFVTFLSVSVALLLRGEAVAVTSVTPQQEYIAKYSRIAVEEMYRSGVPASITLAQGLLESGYGRSELAVKANNHFGIKCHDWKGPSVSYDDDRKGECFRKYEHASASFMDHSDFLRYRDRYKFLFDLPVTDYKGWAYGLKKAGYATDPAYPAKLIKLIEENKLYEYDTMPADWLSETDKVSDSGNETRMSRRERRAARRHDKGGGKTQENVSLPQSPALIEQPQPLTEKQKEIFRFALSRQMYSKNGVPFVYAADGETYASIARCYGLFQREILKFNDLKDEAPLRSGTVVYLQAKKKEAPAGLDKYVAEGDGNLRDIAQRFAVRLESICKMNGWAPDYIPSDGEVVILRKSRR